jgi:hypothetical protein
VDYKIELKAIRHYFSLSKESNAFDAKVYVNGTPMFSAEDDGWGGAINILPLKPEHEAELRKIEKWIRETYPINSVGNHGEPATFATPQDESDVRARLIAKWDSGDTGQGEDGYYLSDLELVVGQLVTDDIIKTEEKRAEDALKKDVKKKIVLLNSATNKVWVIDAPFEKSRIPELKEKYPDYEIVNLRWPNLQPNEKQIASLKEDYMLKQVKKLCKTQIVLRHTKTNQLSTIPRKFNIVYVPELKAKFPEHEIMNFRFEK